MVRSWYGFSMELSIDEILGLPDDDQWHSAPVCRMLGVTYRQLDYWQRTSGFGPEGGGSGAVRLWTKDDLINLWLLSKLVLIRTTATNILSPETLRSVLADVLATAVELEEGWRKILDFGPAANRPYGEVRRKRHRAGATR